MNGADTAAELRELVHVARLRRGATDRFQETTRKRGSPCPKTVEVWPWTQAGTPGCAQVIRPAKHPGHHASLFGRPPGRSLLAVMGSVKAERPVCAVVSHPGSDEDAIRRCASYLVQDKARSRTHA